MKLISLLCVFRLTDLGLSRKIGQREFPNTSDYYHHFERTSPLRSNWPKLKHWNPSDAKTTPETTSVPKLQPAVDYSNLSDPSSNDLSSSRESSSLLKNAFRKPSKTSWPASRPMTNEQALKPTPEMNSRQYFRTSPQPDLDYSDLSGSNDVSSPLKASYGDLKINSWPASRPAWRPSFRKSPKVLLNQTSMEILDSFGSTGLKLHDLFSSGDSSSSVETLRQKPNTNSWLTPRPTWGLSFGTSPKRAGRQIPMQGFRSSWDISSWLPEIFRWTKEPTLKPSPETTLKPTPETTLKPSPETTLKPSPQTTLKPSPETTLKPSPQTTLKPSPETTLKPSPQTTLKPSPETTLKPSTETTSLPKSDPALDESGLSGSSSNDLSSSSESSSSRETSEREPNRTEEQNSDPFKPSGLRSNITTSSRSSWWPGLMSGWTTKATPGIQRANKNKNPDGFLISYNGRSEWHGVMLPVAEGKKLLSGDTSGVPHDATTESSKLASRLAKDPPFRVNFKLDG